jgi:hypothetical protein
LGQSLKCVYSKHDKAKYKGGKEEKGYGGMEKSKNKKIHRIKENGAKVVTEKYQIHVYMMVLQYFTCIEMVI